MSEHVSFRNLELVALGTNRLSVPELCYLF